MPNTSLDMPRVTADMIVEWQSHVEAQPGPVSAEPGLYNAHFAVETRDEIPMSETLSGCLTFVKKKGRYYPEKQAKLRNNLLAGTGFLALANASDFAANVWKNPPAPTYALVLMGIGGTVALGIIYFAIRDALLSWRNLRGLLAERRYLLSQRAHLHQHKQMIESIDCLLDVNFREMGTEIVDRIVMDIIMGFGALMVGIGTYMAISNITDTVFQTSRLLSGYIGNSPCALYGLINVPWSAYIWRRACRHVIAARKEVKAKRVEQMLEMRTSSVRLYGALNGITGIVAGAASLVTATMWWGYVVLAPCIVISALVNYLWRHRIGYHRPFVREAVSFEKDTIVAELIHIDSCRQRLMNPSLEALSALLVDSTSLSCLIEFIISNKLFEEFCLRVLADVELSALLFETSSETLTIDSRSLATIDNVALRGRLVTIAHSLIMKAAPKCFDDQERYLLEALGCYMCNQGNSKHRDVRGTTNERLKHQRYVNNYTECGRHGDAWLFGGLFEMKAIRTAPAGAQQHSI